MLGSIGIFGGSVGPALWDFAALGIIILALLAAGFIIGRLTCGR